MRKNKGYQILMASLAISIGAAACGSAGADTGSGKEVACKDIKSELTAADQELEEAQARLDDVDGPAEVEASDAVKAAVSIVENLTNQAKACEAEITTTTTAPPKVGDVVVNGDSLAEGFEDPTDVDPNTELAFQEDAEAAMATADQERGSAAHSDETLETIEELTTWVNDANNPDAVPVRERVVAAITEVCGEEDVAVHLEQNEGWLLMVVRPESQIRGTSYMTESGLQIASNWRQVGENDAYWLPVCTQGENKGDVAWDGVVRADCGNAHETPKIRINRPDTPVVPPVDIPTGEKCPFNPALPVDSPNCIRGKDHTESPVSDDPNDPDERIRPNIPAPPVVIRTEPVPGSTTTTQPPPPSTIPDPPEVQKPRLIDPTTPTTAPATQDPIPDGPCGDADVDGYPDDC